ncbi:MAG: undecaprenyldiphospho-muramoylpentapeptide beta-N-acetylglucosaminyltransferase [Ruminococcaceae bacterium]|nr:undecaprenyldiphospho-muramoylpentapeptide beta-N-acetylglucosaminyltransferase [Oscillospiraceae bacterium]
MKLFISGGGTAGHINPALAIASEIEKRQKDIEVYYVGTPKGMENKLVKKYPMYHIQIQGIKRSLSLENIKTAYYTATSFIKAKKLLKREKPDLVVGTGGYACWPIVSAAASLGIPSALHESNSIPGFVVKNLQKKVDVVFVNFEATKKLFDKKANVVHVGTPLRPDFETVNREKTRKDMEIGSKYRAMILSFGGSLGANRINDEVLGLMNTYGRENPDVLLIHSTGSRHFAEVSQKAKEMGLSELPNVRILEYISDMPEKMSAADLVICRSGALTLSELAYLGVPSILIPSPNVTDDQQYKNAKLFAEDGAAIVIREGELDGDTLYKSVSSVVDDEKMMEDMRRAALKLAIPDSGDRICKCLFKIIEDKKKK